MLTVPGATVVVAVAFVEEPVITAAAILPTYLEVDNLLL
jgi:hypothetical protein